MQLDPTISFGSILQCVVFVAGLAGAYYSIIRRMDLMEERVGMIWSWFKSEHDINGKPDKEPDKQQRRKP